MVGRTRYLSVRRLSDPGPIPDPQVKDQEGCNAHEETRVNHSLSVSFCIFAKRIMTLNLKQRFQIIESALMTFE